MTNRKIRDILPPTEKKETFFQPKEKINRQTFKPKLNLKMKTKPGWKKKILFTFLFILIFLFFFSVFYLPKAEIEIWPETETFNLETDLTITDNNTQVFQKEKSLTETFSATGKTLKEEKAEGIIRVYNEYSESAQTLIATTRFVSADGKVFRTTEKVTVPGGSYEKGKLVPGEIDIKVVADEPGPEYNINPTTFSIPGFAGTDRYLKFYAKSFESMKNGFKQEVAKITEQDLEQAENNLIEKVKKECQQFLEQELIEKQDYYSFQEEIETEIIDKFSLANAEEEKQEFVFQVKANCQTLLFQKKFIEDYVKKAIKDQWHDDEKNIVQESLEINYSAEKIDLDSGQIDLSLNVFARTYSAINETALKNALVGKSLTETEIFLKNQSKILKANVNLWPFWVRKVPQNTDKTNVYLRFSPANEF